MSPAVPDAVSGMPGHPGSGASVVGDAPGSSRTPANSPGLLEHRAGDVLGRARPAPEGQRRGDARADGRADLALGRRRGHDRAHGRGGGAQRADAHARALLDRGRHDPGGGVGVADRPQRRGQRRQVAGPVQVGSAAGRPQQGEAVVPDRPRDARGEGQPRRPRRRVLHAEAEHRRRAAGPVQPLRRHPVAQHPLPADLHAGGHGPTPGRRPGMHSEARWMYKPWYGLVLGERSRRREGQSHDRRPAVRPQELLGRRAT